MYKIKITTSSIASIVISLIFISFISYTLFNGYIGYGDNPIFWSFSNTSHFSTWQTDNFGTNRTSAMFGHPILSIIYLFLENLVPTIPHLATFIYTFTPIFILLLLIYKIINRYIKNIYLSVSLALFAILNNFILEQLIIWTGNYFYNVLALILLFYLTIKIHKSGLDMRTSIKIILASILILHPFFITMYIFYLLLFTIFLPKIKKTKFNLLKSLLVIIGVILIHSYWLIPFLYNMTVQNTQSFYAGNQSSIIIGYSQMANYINLFNYANYPGLLSLKLHQGPIQYIFYFGILTTIILILNFDFLINQIQKTHLLGKIKNKIFNYEFVNKKQILNKKGSDYKFILFLIFIYLLFLTLALGPNSKLTGDLWLWAFNHVPGFGFFRSFTRFLIVSIISTIFIFALFFKNLNLKRKYKNVIGIIGIFILISSNLIFFTGNLDGTISSADISNDYFEVNNKYFKTNESFNIISYPNMPYESYIWSKNDNTRYIQQTIYFNKNFFSKPLLNNAFAYNLQNKNQLFSKLFAFNNGFKFYEDFDNDLSNINVKYVLVRKDLFDIFHTDLGVPYEKYYNYFSKNDKYILKKDNRNFALFEKLNYKEIITTENTNGNYSLYTIPVTKYINDTESTNDLLYPTISSKPFTLKWYLSQLKERYNIFKTRNDVLANADKLNWLAAKRIVELSKYKDELNKDETQKLINDYNKKINNAKSTLDKEYQKNNIKEGNKDYWQLAQKILNYSKKNSEIYQNEQINKTNNVYQQWLDDISNFNCNGICYKAEIQEDGRYNIKISKKNAKEKPQTILIKSKNDSSINQYNVFETNTWYETNEIELKKGNYILEINNQTNNDSLKSSEWQTLDFHENNGNIDINKSNILSEFVIQQSDETGKTEIIKNTINYKEISGWENPNTYKLSLDYLSKNGTLRLSILEDITNYDYLYEQKDIDVNNINFNNIPTAKKLTFNKVLKDTEMDGYKEQEKDCDYSEDNYCFSHYETTLKAGAGSKKGYLYITTTPNYGEFASIKIRNLKISKIYEPDIKIEKNNEINNKTILPNIAFNKINETRYNIKIENAISPYTLTFRQSFNDQWNLYYINDNGKKVKIGKHHEAEGYANGWDIQPEDIEKKQNYNLILEFWPQKLFYISSTITIITLITVLISLLYIKFKSKNKDDKEYIIEEKHLNYSHNHKDKLSNLVKLTMRIITKNKLYIYIKNKIYKHQKELLIIFSILLFINIYFIKTIYDSFDILLFILWILIVKVKKYNDSVSGITALLLSITLPFWTILKYNSIAEKTATWVYLFMVVTVIQQIWKYIIKDNKDKH